MKIPTHTERSLKILEQVVKWGFSREVQQRLGAFAVVWGLFESNLETTLWALRGERVARTYPSTDKMASSDWIKELGESRSQLPAEAQDVLRVASLAAHDLMDYWHAVLHGSMIPAPVGPFFIRNPLWHVETRKRPSHDAHIDANLLDMAIDSAWVLCQLVAAAREACTDPPKMASLIALKEEISRVRKQSNELRHLTEMANDEKY